MIPSLANPNLSHLFGQSVDNDGQESVGGVVLEEVHGLEERVGRPVGVDGEEELAREAGHVLVEGVLHEERQAAVEPVAVHEQRPLQVLELEKRIYYKKSPNLWGKF